MNAIKKRNLSELLSGIKDAPSTKITGICDDSRNIKKGDVFFAFQVVSFQRIWHFERNG